MARKKSLVIEILGNNKMGRAVRDAMGDMRRMGQFAGRIGKGIARAFKVATVGVAAFTAGLAVTLKKTAGFNVAMARAWTMTGGGISNFKAMREEVMALSSELGVAKDQLSSGLYQALSAGVSQDNVFGFLRIAAKTAIADGSEIEVAVDGITTLLNAFGIESSKTGQVVDQMFAVVKGGKTTFGDLAANLSKAAPVAAALGVGMDQILAAVAALTKQGTPTEVALTSLRNIMLSLNKELGDGWAKSYTLQDALQKVAKKADYSATALEGIFSKRDVAQVFGLVGENADEAAEALDNMTRATGSLTDAYQKVQQFRFWERLKNTLSTVALQFGIVVEEGADLAELIDKISIKAGELGADYAKALLPYIQEIKGAVDNMLSSDPAKIKEGKQAIEAMFDQASAYVKPRFEEWGEAAGSAIWRGFKKGATSGVNKYAESTERKTAGTWGRRALTFVSAPSAFQGGFSGAQGSLLDKFNAGVGAAATDIKRSWLGPGSSKQNPQYVQEVTPISGVEGP